MSNWFECKIKYDKILENGMQKKVIETYLLDALSFTEAESRIIEEITPFISGEFMIYDIKRSNISELFFDETGDKWYKCKINFITIDETIGMEKKTVSYMLVQASDLPQALGNLTEGMNGTMADYEIASVTETNIIDVYSYESKESENNNTEVLRFINQFPDGKCTQTIVAGKPVIIDKTGEFTKVIPVNDDIPRTQG